MTMKFPAEQDMFKDEFVKNTPSFIVLDDDQGIEINRNHNKEDSDQTPAQNSGVAGSFDSNAISKNSQDNNRKLYTQKSS